MASFASRLLGFSRWVDRGGRLVPVHAAYGFVGKHGNATLSGTFPDGITSVEGLPTPAEVRVYLRAPEAEEIDGLFMTRRTSAGDGTWEIGGLRDDQRFDVVGRKDDERDVIVSDVTPVGTLRLEPVALVFAAGFDSTLPLRIRGGVAPYTSVVSSGSLPTGVTLVDNELVGVGPTGTLGAYPVDIDIEDARGTTVTVTVEPWLTLLPFALTGGFSSPFAAIGDVISASFAPNGGEPPYAYTLTGTVPAGLSFNSTTGEMSGTTTTAGEYSFDIEVEDTQSTVLTESYTFVTFAGTPHKFWRMNATASNNHLSVSEMEMAAFTAGSNLCVGGTPIAGSFYPAGSGYTYDAANAFNGGFLGTTDSWASLSSTTGWLGYEFPVPVDVAEFRIAGRTAGTQSPKDFTLEYSDDGVTWTVAATVTGQTSWTYTSFTAFAV
jgi:hypothetical protein